ncbi:hypothetical protein FLJC2902T_21630 [Flavobacterium limnosediminis JC2902]|uniref:Uncharacterized protein n=1 Tax=Flavobacterium limnosediminis JC2902 TaxID=1341181 RepID=V6SL79_9FLAO|nr:hypothetical protein FLJC2902T_21630 [Flavobacterium limnosediminis JC2902]
MIENMAKRPNANPILIFAAPSKIHIMKFTILNKMNVKIKSLFLCFG